MDDQANNTRQEKQAYIVQNIDPNYYEDFHEFCTSYAGEINIDAWTINYVHELVSQFKAFMKKSQEQEAPHQKSFSIYQTTSGENQFKFQEQINTEQPIPNETVTSSKNTQNKKQFHKTKNQNPKTPNSTKTSPNISPQSFAKKKVVASQQKIANPKQSAVDLLDSVFDKIENEAGDENKQKKDNMNKSFFDSSNFWEVPKIESPKKEQQKSAKKIGPSVSSPKTQPSPYFETMNKKPIQKAAKKKQQKKEIKESLNTQSKKQEKTQSSNFDPYFNVGNINESQSINASITSDIKSQFDTFSQMAEDEIKKQKNAEFAVTQNKSQRPKANSTIRLKQIKQFKPSSTITLGELNSPISSKASKDYYKASKLSGKGFQDQVSCVKSQQRSALVYKSLKVQIRKFEIITRSIFASNYLMYDMKVLPMGTICKRNYDDFLKLKLTLQKFYPGIQLPFLERDSWRPGTSQQHAKKQGHMLQFFMADIIGNHELRNSRITEEFLTLSEHKKMKRKFEEYDKMTKLKSLEELCLLEGKVNVSLTEKTMIYNENMRSLVNKVENNLQKFRKNCEALGNYYSQATSTLLNIDQNLKQIQTDVEDFNRNIGEQTISNLNDSLKKVRELFKENFNRIRFEKKVIEEDLTPFLRYEKENTRVSKQILEACHSLTSRYLKRIESESNQSTDSYLSQSNSQFKNGIREQSKNVLVLKYQAGYMQSQCSKELPRIFWSLGEKINLLWTSLGPKYLEQFTKSAMVWKSAYQ